jgi:hypothetical protein
VYATTDWIFGTQRHGNNPSLKLISAESMCSNTVPAVNELSIDYITIVQMLARKLNHGAAMVKLTSSQLTVSKCREIGNGLKLFFSGKFFDASSD